jgi:hypothetical protein
VLAAMSFYVFAPCLGKDPPNTVKYYDGTDVLVCKLPGGTGEKKYVYSYCVPYPPEDDDPRNTPRI